MAERILVIGPTWVGDMVMAQSLYMSLKRDQPGISIDVVAPAWSLPLIRRMPEVDAAIEAPFARGRLGLGDRIAFSRRLRDGRYDRAIVLPNSFKSALSPWLAGIPVRTGWRGEMRYGLLNDLRVLDKANLPLMVDRFNALAFPRDAIRTAGDFPVAHPQPRLRTDAEAAAATMARLGLDATVPVLALCPGAEYGPSKQWLPEHYAALADSAVTSGRQVWIFGSAGDRDVAGAILAAIPDTARPLVRSLAGETTLEEAVDLLAVADAIVSNDSGLLHVSAAVDRPIVGVYGSTTPEFTPPLSDKSRTVRLGLDCSPCFERKCPLGHGNCMKHPAPSLVRGALGELGVAVREARAA